MSKDKKIEQQRLALEVEKLAKEKEDVGRTIMFINPRMLDDKAREYWELSRAKIWHEIMVVVVVMVAEMVFEAAEMVVATW
jgi:hypothetical protein